MPFESFSVRCGHEIDDMGFSVIFLYSKSTHTYIPPSEGLEFK